MNRRQRKKKKAQVFTIILGCTAFCKAEQYEKMFEYMDGIVDAVEEFGQAAVDVAVFVTICTAKAVLIITAPVWILPYAIWRKGVSSEIQTVEKELQEKNME